VAGRIAVRAAEPRGRFVSFQVAGAENIVLDTPAVVAYLSPAFA